MNKNKWVWQTSGLLVLILIELLYVATTRYLLGLFGSVNDVELEAIRTGVRLVSAGLTWWIFKDVVSSVTHKAISSFRKLSWKTTFPFISVILFLSVPVVIGNWNLNEDGTRFFFALTSFPVGLREELVYRGVLLTLLAKRFGFIPGLIISTIAFTFYHYGALPWTTFNITQYVAAGVLLGSLFWITKSLWLVIWIHTVYDAIWCYTPFLTQPMSNQIGIIIVCASAIIITVWVCIKHNSDRQHT